MANKMKKTFALVMALCMLTGMLPVQALAEDTATYALENVEGIEGNMTVEGNQIVVEFTPAAGSDNNQPAGSVEWESNLTLGEKVDIDVTDVNVSSEKTGSSDSVTTETVKEQVTVKTEGATENGAVIKGQETVTETTTTVTETIVESNTETVQETVTTQTVVAGTEGTELKNAEITPEDNDLPEVDVPAFPNEVFEGEEGTHVDEETGTTTTIEKDVDVDSESTTSKEHVGQIDKYDYTFDIYHTSDTTTVTTTTEKATITEQEKVEEENKKVETSTTTNIDKTTVETLEESVDKWYLGDRAYFADVQQKTDTVVTTSTKVNVSEVVEETIGDVKEDENDLEFDFTNIKTTIIRDVTTEVEAKVDDESTFDMEQVVAPEDYEGKKYSDAPVKATSNSKVFNGLQDSVDPDAYNPAPQPEDESYKGYDYVLSGEGESTWAAAPVFMKIVYQRNPETGEALIDEETGEYLIDESQSGLVYAGDKAGNSGMDGTPGQIVVRNKEGEHFYTYCIDKETETFDDSWYKITNLEDSDYYPDEESADMLRAIVTNGYWGTDANVYETDAEGNVLVDDNGNKIAKKDEDGNIIVDASVDGSLAKIKALMRSTYGDEDTVTVKDKAGNEHTYNIEALIDGLKEHEALAVTQAAIWSYSNGSLATQNGEDGVICIGVQSAQKYHNTSGGWVNQYAPTYNLESDARLKALYDLFMNMDPMEADPENTTTIINEDNFVEDVHLSVGDMAEHEDNYDDDDTNDVYETELKFSLAFVVDESDNLTVVLFKDNEPVMSKHLALTNENGDEDTIVADEYGVYTLNGLQLSENEDFKFDLKLQGTQVLKEGVYVYTSHGGTGHSQTLVGMAAGTQNVDVSASMTISFDVNESKTVVATHKWSNANDPETETTTITPPPGEEEEPPPPVQYRMTRGVGQLEIIVDEEVPLAEVPQTGDNSMVWFALILMSVCGLCILNLSDKKCKA